MKLFLIPASEGIEGQITGEGGTLPGALSCVPCILWSQSALVRGGVVASVMRIWGGEELFRATGG